MFEKGDKIGATGGRPKGARNKLGHAFITALQKDFEEHGETIIKVLRVESPVDYCRLVAGLVPKELEIEMNSRHYELKEWLAWIQLDFSQAMVTKAETVPALPDPMRALAKPQPQPRPRHEPFNASEAAPAEPVAERRRLQLTPREEH